MKKKLLLITLIIAAAGSVGLYWFYRNYFEPNDRMRKVFEYLRDPEQHADERIAALSRCGDAPFIFPTDGLIGFLWGDSFRIGHRHQGIDIFAGSDTGITPVYAAYDGYLTRLTDWKSSVIIRIPEDPLQPDRQIWAYYTHMADVDGRSFIDTAFPAGTEEVFVTAGTLLGYQGNYSGNPGNPTGIHLHFSLVRDDGSGSFMNELEIRNTLDPSPYFEMDLNGKENTSRIPACTAP